MIAPAVAFLDTMPDARIQLVARRSGAAVVWVLEGLARHLAYAGTADPQRNPPTLEQAQEEVTALADAGAPSAGPPT